MSKKLFYLVSFVLVLGLANTSVVSAIDLDTDPALVGWWTFDEGTGNIAADSSGNGNDGTLNGPLEWTTEGKIGGAMAFTGPYNFVLVEDAPSLNMTQEITIAAWINPSWTGNNRILQKSSGGGDNQYRLIKEGGNNIRVHLPPASNFEITGNIPPQGEWTHLAATYDHSMIRVYYDGVVVGETAFSGNLAVSNGQLFIGNKWAQAPAGDEFNGIMDDVRIYNRALTQSEIKRLGGNPAANTPSPADRAIHQDTWATLGWTPGAFATSHDIYIGTNMDDVTKGIGDTFIGNQASPFVVAGFPGFLFPDGLVPGTTYYWRVDEVNDANPDSPWKGDLWRFTIPPSIAWKPNPPDNARLVSPEADLSWNAGKGGRMHTVYFGETFEEVDSAAGGAPQIPTTYALNTLELGKTYYWRVDEFNGATTLKGDIWSFTTGDASIGGIKGEYWNNLDLSGAPILSRVEPGIDYNWGGAAPGPGVDAPVFSARWTGVLNIPYTETYTFYLNVQSGVRLWVDGQLIINNWMAHHMAIEYQGRVDLEVGMVPIVAEIANISGGGYGGGAVMQANLSWSNPSLSKEIIPQSVLLLPVWAGRPTPANGAADVSQTATFRWDPGDEAASHEVYFGTDASALEAKGSQALGSEIFDPGQLEMATTYYWRIDEVNSTNAGSPWTGEVWSFTTAAYPVIDDMENYNDIDPAEAQSNNIFYAWVDGFDSPATNGALVGNEFPPYAEQNIVHGGKQSMPYFYDNAVGNSEATLTLTSPRDWTGNGMTKLTIYFKGDPANAPEQMYVALNGTAVVNNDNPDAATVAIWTEWTIDLQAFFDQGVDLTNVDSITIGFGDKANPQAGGSGTVLFDDVILQ
ncbi:MAG: hypothetical protein H8D56_15410 [Planctomycetes bacterium]|nr:hypothetical protein [Planctomycetota bacterium]MBL7146428.1 hypothetical protein [Phycisphaerae bacterium]